MRTMTVEKLLKGMPILQSQIDALLDFEVSLESFLFIIYIWTPRHPVCLSGQVQPKDLNNRVINACFLLLFKDLIKLYACYNDGIINLLGRSVSLKSVRGITGIESHILAALPHQKSSSRWREASVKTGWRSTSGSWHGWRGFRSSLKSRRWNPDLIPHTAAVTSVSCWIQPALFFFLHSQQMGIDKNDIPELTQVRIMKGCRLITSWGAIGMLTRATRGMRRRSSATAELILVWWSWSHARICR